MIKVFAILLIIFCIIIVALIIGMCIQVKRAEENFYEYQMEYERDNEYN